MSRRVFFLYNDRIRDRVVGLVRSALKDTVVTFQDPARTTKQNSRMWAMLADVSEQLLWHGVKYTDAEWKDYFMHAYRGHRWMPDEDGGEVPIGHHTSHLSIEEHSDLTMLIEAFGARQGVVFSEPKNPSSETPHFT